jgi:oligopeptide/dipeptide ABC transporter ATP-binding protein
MSKTILEVIDLKKHFTYRRGILSAFKGAVPLIPAVDGVSFYLKENETVGLVGESGCGKTTIGRTILRLTPATSGKILFDGKDIIAMPPEELRQLRSEMQMIFQDLDAALNPKMRVRDILKESITVHHKINGAEVDKKIGELLEQVNLKKNKLSNFPHELSGGEKRRVGLARALSVGARFIVADEPTSALDVSIQAQVVNLLRDLQKQLGLSYLFISHDLRVVELISHKVAVMYLGKIVEMGLSGRIANRASHPYTHILWSSLVEKQSREASQASKNVQAGRWGVFDFERPVAGCRFAPRCPVYESMDRPTVCTDPATEPQLRNLGAGHYAACHFPL